jgi:DNA adenine methylase
VAEHIANQLIGCGDNWRTYAEPFVGGGAVFCELYNRGALQGKKVILADADPYLIALYRALQTDPLSVLPPNDWTDAYAKTSHDERRAYYKQLVEAWNLGAQRTPQLYLTLRTLAFNGLWRVNKSGNFNSPWNQNSAFRSPSARDLENWHKALQGVTLRALDFREVLNSLSDTRGCLIYVDPPYLGGFQAYTAKGFNLTDHKELIGRCSGLAVAGNRVAYSHVSGGDVEGLLTEWWPLGRLTRLSVRRSVAASAAARKEVEELLVVGGRV